MMSISRSGLAILLSSLVRYGGATAGQGSALQHCWQRCNSAWAWLMVGCCVWASTRAADTADLSRRTHLSTAEVVVAKSSTDPLSYEKPLPFELIPYQERTDPYEAVGTAFCLQANTWVTAAHVLAAVVNHQYGAPHIRLSDGHVYAIDSIEKFSNHEDFAVFSVTPSANCVGLPTRTDPHIDDRVLAVGTALGEGIVMRDGLLTSQTPEEMDGRWKWLRFSAAASPGNSGGPLLDAQGAVLGVVTAKSPNENLNYALPIANVISAPENKAQFEGQQVVSLPFMQGTLSRRYAQTFVLPLSWPEFERHYQSVMNQNADSGRRELLHRYDDSRFPKGPHTEAVLYGLTYRAHHIGAATEGNNKQWSYDYPEFRTTDLPDDGLVALGTTDDLSMFRVRRPARASDDAFYSDPKAFMELLIRGLDIRRSVGHEWIRVTALGKPVTDSWHTDAYGRKWQRREWPLPYENVYLIVESLPTPEGYVGVLDYASSADREDTEAVLDLWLNQLNVVYEGTLAQWQAFLHRGQILPVAVSAMSLVSQPLWALRTRRFSCAVPASAVKLDTHSLLAVSMGFLPMTTGVEWDVEGLWWFGDTKERNFLGLVRKSRPPLTADISLRNEFETMHSRKGSYDARPRGSGPDTYDVDTIVQVPASKEGMASGNVLYDLEARFEGEHSVIDMSAAAAAASEKLQVLEHDDGGEEPLSAQVPVAVEFEQRMNEALKSLLPFDAEYGLDMRGRQFHQDVEDYLLQDMRTLAHANVQALSTELGVTPGSPTDAVQSGLAARFGPRMAVLQHYWALVPSLRANRDLWEHFLSLNHMPGNTAHNTSVQVAEATLRADLGRSAPEDSWVAASRALIQAYVNERANLAKAGPENRDAPWRARESACPEAAAKTSGSPRPVMRPAAKGPAEYYPVRLQHLGVEGTVVLNVRVAASGCVVASAVRSSSGAEQLDRAAQEWIENVSYLPAENHQQAIESFAPVAVAFRLED